MITNASWHLYGFVFPKKEGESFGKAVWSTNAVRFIDPAIIISNSYVINNGFT